MASVLVQIKVKEFAVWKKVFDANASNRVSHGELSTQIYRDASDSNKISILGKWKSIENAQNFMHSPELKAAMENAGVEGPPHISFLNEA